MLRGEWGDLRFRRLRGQHSDLLLQDSGLPGQKPSLQLVYGRLYVVVTFAPIETQALFPDRP